jgi:hypothetical protein
MQHLFNADSGGKASAQGQGVNPLSVVGDVLGKVWGLPNTVLGLAYGGVGHVIGEVGQAFGIFSAEPNISFGNNAIQFENNPLMLSAMTFGNAVVYGTHPARHPNSPRYGGAHTLGFEEMQHTYQSQVLGPLYFPAHIVSGVTGLIRNGSWHGSSAFLEHGPHLRSPTPW